MVRQRTRWSRGILVHYRGVARVGHGVSANRIRQRKRDRDRRREDVRTWWRKVREGPGYVLLVTLFTNGPGRDPSDVVGLTAIPSGRGPLLPHSLSVTHP